VERRVIPFSKRKVDWIFLGFFLINPFFIMYVVDIEQLSVHDPYQQEQAVWPPALMIRMIHWYGNNFDPLLMARPQWWQMTIWLDVLFYGPFYVAAVHAFLKGREWIRIPAIFYSGMLFADVFIILGEETAGPRAAPNLPLVLGLNRPWLLLPIFPTLRLRKEHQFTSSHS